MIDAFLSLCQERHFPSISSPLYLCLPLGNRVSRVSSKQIILIWKLKLIPNTIKVNSLGESLLALGR